MINDWAKILDNKGQVDTFILDFEKAFDTPPHELLKSFPAGCVFAEYSTSKLPISENNSKLRETYIKTRPYTID